MSGKVILCRKWFWLQIYAFNKFTKYKNNVQQRNQEHIKLNNNTEKLVKQS